MSARYQVTNKGRMWHVIDRSTGKTLAFRQSYLSATQLAQNWSSSEAVLLRAAVAV